MYFLGHGACPIWESCFLNMGKQFSQMGRIAFQRLPDTGIYIHVYVYRIQTTVNRGESSSYYTL